MMIYGNIVEEDGLKPGILEFEDGVVTNLIREPQSPRNDLFDEYGSFIDRYFQRDMYLIFPGFVDLGATCHYGSETYASAAIAALNGGITALADISENPDTTASAIDVVPIYPDYNIVPNTTELFSLAGKAATTPFHLFFNNQAARRSLYLKSAPPLPTPEEQEEIFKHLDVFDYLISGHVPNTAMTKIQDGNIFGLPGLDTFGSFIAWLIKNEKTDTHTIFDIACKTPGETFEAMTGRKVGRLAAGSEASFTVLNMAKTAEHGRPIMSKSGWSPFDLRYLPGYVEVVYYKGEKVVDGAWVRNFVRTF